MQSDTTLSWWYRYKKYVWMFLLVLFLLSFTVFVVCSYVFNLSWTGFNESKGPNVLQYQPTKTVWDWLQLLVIPVVLSIAAYWFNRVNNQTEQKMTVQRDETEHAIALDSQREELLQDYLDRMSDLLLVHNLRNSQAYSEVRNIARARTLTILPRLDDKRKGSLIQFLYESHLIASGKESCILLHDANLSGADLTGFNLSGANLSGTDLREAKLSETNLSDAQLKEICLHKANLSGAIMYNTNLHKADLSHAILNGARLHGADITQANLSDASLIRTDLSRADLSEAIVNGAKFQDTITDHATLSSSQREKMKQL